MINQDFTEFPEHRSGFFRLLRGINAQCFPALLSIPPQQFKLLMDSIVWAIKHTMRDIADIGLGCTFFRPRFDYSSFSYRSMPGGREQFCHHG